jgi:hydroxymethylpyrimidine pyrophosphatase-like HAD family hydrolase
LSDLSGLPLLSANRKRIKDLVSSLRVIYTDVDGTLVGPGGCFLLDSKKNFTLQPARSLVAAYEQGVDIVIVSGRNRFQLLEDARLLGINNYIAEMGCQIVYQQGREILQTADDLLADQPEKNVYQFIQDSGAVELLFGRFEGLLEYHTPWSECRECTHLFRGCIDVDQANNLLTEKGFSYLKIVDNGLIRMAGSLRGLAEIHSYHLLPRQSGKVEAVQADIAKRQLLRHEVAAVGDALADLKLANHVGAFFLVKNALRSGSSIETAMKQFDNVFVTAEEMGLGFAEAVELLLS